MIKKMSFSEKIKMRMYAGIAIAIVGLITVAITWSMLWTTQDLVGVRSHYQDFNWGFFSGLGGGLTGAGIMTFYKNRKLLKNPEKFREKEIKENDERNIYLNQKALSISATICIIILYFASIGAAFFDNNVSMVLIGCGSVALTIYLLVYSFLKKRY